MWHTSAPPVLDLQHAHQLRHILAVSSVESELPLEVEQGPGQRRSIGTISFQLEEFEEILNELVMFLLLCNKDDVVYMNGQELIAFLMPKNGATSEWTELEV